MNLVPIGDLEWFSFYDTPENHEDKQEGDIWNCLLWILQQNGSDEGAIKKYQEHIQGAEEEVLQEFLNDFEEGHIAVTSPKGERVEGSSKSIQLRDDFPELLILDTVFSRLHRELYEARESVAKNLHHTLLIFHVLEIDFLARLKGLSTLLEYSSTELCLSDPQIADLKCKYSPKLLHMLLKNGGSGLLNNVLNAQLVKISTDTPNEENNERIIAMLCTVLADVFPKQIRDKEGGGTITVDTISRLLQANFDLLDATEYPKRRSVSGRIKKALDTIPESFGQGVIAWKFKKVPKANVRVKSVEVEIETDNFETVVERWGVDDPISVFANKDRDFPTPKVKTFSAPKSKK